MASSNITIQSKVGLHSKNATKFIQLANEFKSSIWIESLERRVNAKSLLGVLSLGVVQGMTVKLIAEGVDETQAVSAIKNLVDSNFID